MVTTYLIGHMSCSLSSLAAAAPIQASCSLFPPRRNGFDLDQPCLSTSAGHKGPQAKLFILTGSQENKPHSSLCSLRSPPSKKYPATPEAAWPASSCLSPWCGWPQPRLGPVTGWKRPVHVPCEMSEFTSFPLPHWCLLTGRDKEGWNDRW